MHNTGNDPALPTGRGDEPFHGYSGRLLLGPLQPAAEPTPAVFPYPRLHLTDQGAPITTTSTAGTPNPLASLAAGLCPQRQGCPRADTDLGAMPQLLSPPVAQQPQAAGTAS